MKKTHIAGAAAVSLAALIAGAAVAQQPAAPASERSAARQARADTDSDRRISQAEFVQARVARLTALDANGDGVVTAEEASAGFEARRAERRSALFERLDTDKDGVISRAEFEAHGERAGRGERIGRGERAGRGERMARGPAGPRGEQARPGRLRAEGAGFRAGGSVNIADVRARAIETFARLDTNNDGYLSADERRAGAREGRQGRRAGWAARHGERHSERQASPSAPGSE